MRVWSRYRGNAAKYLIRASPYLLISAISVAVLHQVLFTQGLVMYGDLAFAFPAERHLSAMYPLWSPYGSYSTLLHSGQVPYLGPILGIASVLNISMETVAKLFLLGGLILIGSSMYYASNILLKEYGKGERVAFIASLIAALVYMFNPWVLNRVGHFSIWIAYGLAPLVLVFFMRSLQTRKIRYIVLTALLWCFASASPHFAILMPVLLASWVIFSILCRVRSITRSEILNHVRIISLVVVFYLLFSAFWVLPNIMSGLQTGQIAPGGFLLTDGLLDSLSINSSLLNVFRLMGCWFTLDVPNQPPLGFLHHPWLIASFLLPFFAFASVLLNRNNKHCIYFLLLSVFFMLLARGTQGPFPSTYRWLVFDIPFFSDTFGLAFRDSNKWEGLVALTFCFLIAFAIAALLQTGWKKRASRVGKSALMVVFILFLSCFALFVENPVRHLFADMYVPVEVPQEYHAVNNWLASESEDFKVTWLPDYWGGFTTWGARRIGNIGPFDVWSSSKPSLVDTVWRNPSTRYYWDYTFYHALSENKTAHFGKCLDPVNTRYVLYHEDIVGHEAESTIASLESQMDLEFVKKEGFYHIFENEDYAPHIFVVPQNIAVWGGLNMLTSLNAIESFDPTRCGLLYLDQGMQSDYSNSNMIVLGSKANINDIALAQLDDKYLIAPFDYTVRGYPHEAWSRTIPCDVFAWYFLLDEMGAPNPWDFDYDRGMVASCSSGHRLALPVEVKHEGVYRLYARVLESPRGGAISILMDGQAIGSIDTGAQASNFVWKDLGKVPFPKGKHSLTLENHSGFNAVNVLALMPQEVAEGYFDSARQFLEDRRIAYIMEAESDLDCRNGVISNAFGGGASGGGVLVLPYPSGLGIHPSAIDTSNIEAWERVPQTRHDYIWISSDGDSLVMDYTFYDERSEQVVAHTGLELESWGNYDTLSLWVYGDGTGNDLQFWYKSNYDESGGWDIGHCTLDWTGWKELSFTLPEEPRDNVHRFLIIVNWDLNKSQQGLGWHSIEAKDIRLSLEHTSQATASIDVARDSLYKIAIRAVAGPGCKPLVLDIGGNSNEISLMDGEGNLKWVYSESMFLAEGTHTLRILPEGEAEIDSIIVYSTSGDETLEDVFSSEQASANISWEEVDSTKYVAHVEAQAPFMLAFAEAYDSLWVAKVNGVEYKSMPLYSVINGFWIDNTGELDITIEYKPQRWFYYGAAISITTFLVVLAYMVWHWTWGRRKKGVVRS